MASARDTDWTHIHVAGDRDAAAPYVSYARKLLGYVKQDAGYNGLMTHGIERQLSDGAVIRAEIVGGIPRITINPPGGGSDVVEADWFEGVVMCGYSGSRLGAVGFEKVDTNRYGVDFLPLFADKKNAGYIEAPEPKGVWSRIQPELTIYATAASLTQPLNKRRRKEVAKRQGKFKQVYSPGTITHTNSDGDSVSRYGSITGNYFILPHRIASWGGGRNVEHRSRVIFSTEVIPVPPGAGPREWHVYASAMKEGSLYVVVGLFMELPDYWYPVNSYYPHTSDDLGKAFVAPPYAVGDAPIKVLKVNLAVQVDEDTHHAHYKYVDYEVMYEGALHNADGPWMFDDDVTHVVCIARPDESRLTWSHEDANYDAFFSNNVITPSESHLRHFFDLKTRSMSTSDAGDVIAEGNGKSLRIERVGPCEWDYVWSSGRVTAHSIQGDGRTDGVADYKRRQLIYADPKHDRYVFHVRTSTGRYTNYRKNIVVRDQIEVHDRGKVVHPELHTYILGERVPVRNDVSFEHRTDMLDQLRRRLERLDKISALALLYMEAAGRDAHVREVFFSNRVLTHTDINVRLERGQLAYMYGGVAYYAHSDERTRTAWKIVTMYSDKLYQHVTHGLGRRAFSSGTTAHPTLGASYSDNEVFVVSPQVRFYPHNGVYFTYTSGIDTAQRGTLLNPTTPLWAATRWSAPPPQQKRRYIKGVDK